MFGRRMKHFVYAATLGVALLASNAAFALDPADGAGDLLIYASALP